MEERMKQLKDEIQKLNDRGIRKTYIYKYIAESLRTTKGESIPVRRAKGFVHVLEQVNQVILNHEIIAGSMLGMCPVCEHKMTKEEQEAVAVQTIEDYLKKKKHDKVVEEVQFEEGHVKSFEDDFTSKKSRWSLMSRVHHEANIEYKDLQDVIEKMKNRYEENEEIEDYEIGRELERAFKFSYGEDKDLYNQLPWFVGNHINYDYETIVTKGLGKIREEIVHKESRETDEEKQEFYFCEHMTIDAVIEFIQRYVKNIEEAARKAKGNRKSDLELMARNCKHIATEVPDNFHEAVQLIWMIHIIGNIQGGSALSFGRMDQYLYPFYQKDIEKGEITNERVREILSCVWLKINEPKMRTVQSITLGGIRADGSNGVTELTRQCLKVTQEVGMPYPNIGLRINKKNPLWVYEEAMETVKAGCGQPMLLNDDVWIENTKKLGYSQEDANNYYNMGCVEIMVPGIQPNWGVTEAIAFPVLFENLIDQWKQNKDSITDFDAYMKAYETQLERAIQADYQEGLSKKKNMQRKAYDPFTSLFIDGCLENGKDVFQGGSRGATHWSIYAYGIGTVTDSLYAIKKLVFEDKRFTLEEMHNAVLCDFKGYEELLCAIQNLNACYGNGKKEVDEIGNRVHTYYAEKVFELNKGLEKQDRFVSTLFGYFFHIYHGEIAMATPNGRRKGEPFSDSMGPSQGKDEKGPTRLLDSVLNLDNSYVTGGYALNFKVSPGIMNSEEGERAMCNLFQAYIEEKGPQIQAYMTKLEDLVDAQVHPEKHRDLIVRVGGYCEFFVNLDRVLQTEIIKRTTYGEA